MKKWMLCLVLLCVSVQSFAAKRVIMLETALGPNGSDQVVKYCNWYAIAVGNKVPRPGYQSPYRSISTAEMQDLQSGAVVEECDSGQFVTGTSQATIQTELAARWTARNSVIGSLPNPNNNYATSWDGTTWTAGGSYVPVSLSKMIRAPINISATGDNVVIAAQAGQRITVYKLWFQLGGTSALTFKDGASTNFAPSITLNAAATFTQPSDGEPWFVTTAGNAFMINLSVGAQMSGMIYYTVN